jgi:hypothetical protein
MYFRMINCLLLSMVFCLPVSASAQEKKSEQLTAAILTLERKRDVSIPDFEAAIKKHLDFRLTQGEGRHYQVYTPTEGGDYFKFFVRYATVTLAEQDKADEVVFSSDIPANYVEVLSPLLQELTYKQEWIDMENSNWTWPASDQAELVGVTTWSVNPAKSIQMNKARARLSQIALEKGKPNKWVWFTTVGGEETLSLAIPYQNNIERGQVQSFADFASQYIGKEAAEELEQQFNEGFWSKSYKTLHYRPDLSPVPEGEEAK